MKQSANGLVLRQNINLARIDINPSNMVLNLTNDRIGYKGAKKINKVLEINKAFILLEIYSDKMHHFIADAINFAFRMNNIYKGLKQLLKVAKKRCED